MGGATPKQFLLLAGTPLIVHTVRAFRQVPDIASVVVAAPAAHRDECRELLARHGLEAPFCTVVEGGATRQDSVRAALAQVSPEIALVLVHDAARPFVTPEIIVRCLDAAAASGAAIAAIPVRDTLKKAAGGNRISATVDRDGLWQAQTPQAARADLLRAAFAVAARDAFLGTDEAALIERLGHAVTLVEGAETNFKVTRPADLLLAEALLGKKPHPETGENAMFRIGHGYDAHRLVPDRPLVLGGVTVPHHLGLLGHSDADVLTHALCDAILGALAAGDIGRHFPDSDGAYKNIRSILLLEKVVALARERGYLLTNADLTVVAQRPKLAGFIPEMRTNLAAVCGVPADAINIKATTTEQMGFAGREEGIAAHAVALLQKISFP